MTINQLIEQLQHHKALGFGDTNVRLMATAKDSAGKKINVSGPIYDVVAVEGSKEPFRLPVVNLRGFPK